MGCTDSAGESRWYLPRCATEGCNWDVNHEGDACSTCAFIAAREAETTRHMACYQHVKDKERNELVDS